jgi:ectoine hydroxylase-related dioxygenase (phytanoyl-CoA dioxygenase family)
MAIQRLDINKVSQQEARAFFEEHGCVIFSNTGLRNTTKEMREELRDVVQFKYEQINPGTPVNVDSMFDKELVEIHKNDRSQFINVYDVGQSLPSIFALYNNSLIRRALKLLNYNNLSVNWSPRLRLDFPNEDQFLLPDHQDRDFNGGSETSVTVYFQLHASGKQNPLYVRPKTHLLGNLPVRKITERPYILLEEGEWMDKYPEEETNLTDDEILIFHMDLVHRSGLNRGGSPRATIQLRYNNLKDEFYQKSGWPATYRLVSVKDEILKSQANTAANATVNSTNPEVKPEVRV